MFPWAAVIGAGVNLLNGFLSRENNKAMQKAADANAAAEQAELEGQIHQNPLSRSENQHILGQYDRAAQQQIENARGMAAIKGMPGYDLAVQKAVAEGRADLMGNMSAGASARADRLEAEKRKSIRNKYLEDQGRKLQRNSTYAALAGNAASAVGAIMDGYGTPKEKAGVQESFVNPHKLTQLQKDSDAAVDRLNQKAKLKSAQGVTVAQSPTNVYDAVNKMNAKLYPGSYKPQLDPTYDPSPDPSDAKAYEAWLKRHDYSHPENLWTNDLK